MACGPVVFLDFLPGADCAQLVSFSILCIFLLFIWSYGKGLKSHGFKRQIQAISFISVFYQNAITCVAFGTFKLMSPSPLVFQTLFKIKSVPNE